MTELAMTALAELKEQGLVRHIGVSNFDAGQLRRISQIAPVETLQPPYSLVDRDAERELLRYAESAGIGVIVYSPMASGLLTGRMTKERIANMPTGDWRKNHPWFNEPQLSGNLELVGRLARVAERYGTTLEPSPSPGRCATRRSTAPSLASGTPRRSTRCCPRRTCGSPTPTSRR